MILIPYKDDVGFAIGRLIPAFYRAMSGVLGSSATVRICVKERVADHRSDLGVPRDSVVAYDVYGGQKDTLENFCEYLRSERVKVLMALDLSPEAPWLANARRAGLSTVIAYWGAPMSSQNFGFKLLAKRLEVGLLRRNRPDLFIFESEAMRRLAVFGRGIPARDTTIVRTGVDLSHFHPVAGARSVVYERLGIPRNRKIIVFMGHLHERKGVHVLINAANLLLSSYFRRDFHILFLGGDESDVKTLPGFDGVAHNSGFLTFAGYRDDIPEILTGCYLGCLPSSGWDSFPMSSLEMQACGLPVVASDLQGVPETIEIGRTGRVFRSGEARALAETLNEMLDDDQTVAKMSEQAIRRIVSGFTRDHQEIRLMETLRSAVYGNKCYPPALFTTTSIEG